MGKKGKKTQAGKPKKLSPKDVGKRLNALVKALEEELKGADLFVSLPPTEDCAICLVPPPRIKQGSYYQACCGKDICKACHSEHEESINKQNEEKSAGKKVALTCPFCREPEPTPGLEALCRLQARCKQDDHSALTLLGHMYLTGDNGAPKDDLKGLDCYIQAVQLGSPQACVHIGNRYVVGEGVAVDKKRAALFKRIGALRGDIVARHNIGCIEYHSFGNHEIAIRHWKIAAEAGYLNSLNALKEIYYADGKKPGKDFISKDYLESIYRAGHEAQLQVKSEEREKHRTD